jgi:hypothetical protein
MNPADDRQLIITQVHAFLSDVGSFWGFMKIHIVENQ